MHAHTTITPFMHDLDIACKNVLISHNFMMHAYACCTCSLISTCTMFPLTLAKKPIIQMTSHDSLMHHYNTPRTRMRSPDQCSISYLFTPPPPQPFASSYYGLLQQKMPAGYNEHTKCQNVLTPGPHLYDYGVTCMSVLYFHASTMVFKVILINTI